MDGNAITPCAKGGKAVSKYIDVDVFIKGFRETLLELKAQVDPDLTPKAYAYLRGGEAIIEDLTKFPAADVAPVRHGEWLKAEDDYCGLNIIQCSICHEEWCFEIDDDVIDLNYHYCPNCGAKMDGERKKVGINE